MSSRLEEKQRRREERMEAERSQAGFPPRKPPGTRNALGEPNDYPFAWIERNFSRFFAASLIISIIFSIAILVLIGAIVAKLI